MSLLTEIGQFRRSGAFPCRSGATPPFYGSMPMGTTRGFAIADDGDENKRSSRGGSNGLSSPNFDTSGAPDASTGRISDRRRHGSAHHVLGVSFNRWRRAGAAWLGSCVRRTNGVDKFAVVFSVDASAARHRRYRRDEARPSVDQSMYYDQKWGGEHAGGLKKGKKRVLDHDFCISAKLIISSHIAYLYNKEMRVIHKLGVVRILHQINPPFSSVLDDPGWH